VTARAVLPSASASVRGRSAPVLRRCACGGGGGPAGECAECRKKRLQRGPSASAPSVDAAPGIVHDVLRSPGKPLDASTRAFMEPRFGHSFADVRVHADEHAAESASAVGARAYAVGRDVVFGGGMYAPASTQGRKLIAHELAHVVQQRRAPAALSPTLDVGPVDAPEERQADAAAEAVVSGRGAPALAPGAPAVRRQPSAQAICWRPGEEDTAPGADDCSPRRPEQCPTYQQWLAGFSELHTFRARDTTATGTSTTDFDVLGGGAASHDPAAAAAQQAPPMIGEQVTDHFIDHPTDEWVRTCLPENLRQDAYRLPADCADMAVVLRHVWLAAHHRTETFGRWTIGDAAGDAARQHMGTVIGEVYSGNVAQMVSPYADASGRPLRSFAELAPLLHEGDVLVWEHHAGSPTGRRTGGHTQTITHISRGGGSVDSLGVVQGNQPLGHDQAVEIAAEVGRRAPSEDTMRNWPGRRIEAEELAGAQLADVPLPLPPRAPSGTVPQQVWSDDGTTTLVAAGPPRAAMRPQAQLAHGHRVRQLSDWLPALRGASRTTLPGTLEAALQELRATLEGGVAVTDADSAALGRAAGERLWALASRAGGLGEDEHFRPMQEMLAVIQALGHGGSSHPAAVEHAFDVVAPAFGDAARGGTSVSFTRPARRGGTDLKMLVTGFDPFESSGSLAAPARGEWNPSGAAALALDGTTVDGPGRVRTAVEGIVLPVSFDEFRGGIVERLVPASQVDAVITVSLDPNLAPTDPVRLERYAVGVHTTAGGAVEDVPAAPGGTEGPLVLPSTGPVDDIARETRQPGGRGRPDVVPQPATGDDVTFRFASAAAADAALAALGLAAQGEEEVTITSQAAIAAILAGMQRNPQQPGGIVFTAGGVQHRAQVRSGPGGNFLSNEVSYRVLRLLSQQTGGPDRMSFHVHTPGTTAIPQDTSTPAARTARRTAQTAAAGVRTRLVGTLRRVIRATAGQLVARRAASTTTTPQGTP
jgi:hypothetical protein